MGRNRIVFTLVGICCAASILLVGCGNHSDDGFVNVVGTWDVTFSNGTKATFELIQSESHVTGIASVPEASDSGPTYVHTGTYALTGTVKGNTIVLTAQGGPLYPPTFTGIIRGHSMSGHMVEGYREGTWSATRGLAPRYPQMA